MIRRLQDTLIRTSKRLKSLRLFWVPGHMNVRHNEFADQGAKYATSIKNKWEVIPYGYFNSNFDLFDCRLLVYEKLDLNSPDSIIITVKRLELITFQIERKASSHWDAVIKNLECIIEHVINMER